MGVMEIKQEIINPSEARIDYYFKKKETQISENDLPIIISQQVDKLNELDRRINEAILAAEEASKSAEEAKNKSAGFGKKKAAIEELQTASYDLATAVQLGMDAQKASFEFQTKLAEISKYLFNLGVSNIASNRFVVRELELRLKGASKEELSELAQQEIKTIVKQLKEQESILLKLDDLQNKLRNLNNQLQTQQLIIQDIAQRMDEITEAEIKNRERWNKQEVINDNVENQLDEHIEIHKNIENKFNDLTNDLMKQDKKLDEHKEIFTLHNEKFYKLEVINKQYSEKIETLEKKLDSKASLKIMKLNLVLVAVTFFISILHFFI